MRERAAANRASDPKQQDGANEREVRACVEMMSGALWVRDERIACGSRFEVPNARKRLTTSSQGGFSFETWLFAALVLVAIGGVTALSWDLDIDQLTYLSIGSGALLYCAIVWSCGIIGFSHREGFGQPPVTEVTEAPLQREILAPLLLLAGVGFILAGTPTGVGEALSGAAHAAVMLYRFGKEGIEVIFSAAAGVAILTGYVLCFVRRDRTMIAFMATLTALLGIGGGILYLSYRLTPDQYRKYRDDYLEPFRYVAGLFS